MSFFKNMKLGIKLPIFLGSILTLLLLSTSSGFLGLRQNNNLFEEYEKLVDQTILAGRIQANLLESRIAVKNYIDLEDNTQQIVFEDRFSKMKTFINDLQSSTEDRAQALSIEAISIKANEYRESFEKVVENKTRGDIVYKTLNNIGPEMEDAFFKIMQSAYNDRDQAAIFEAGNAQRNLLIVRLNTEKFMANGDLAAIEVVKANLADLDSSLNRYSNTLNSQKNKEFLGLINKDRNIYLNSFNDLVLIIEGNKNLTGRMGVLGAEIASISEEIKLSLIDQQEIFGPSVLRNNNNTIYGMSALSLIAIIITVLISIQIIKMVVVPVKTVTNTFKEISEGDADLKIRLTAISTDELGDMATYFNKFMEKLEVIMVENKNRAWLKTGQTELSLQIRGDQDIMTLGNSSIAFICKYLNAQVGAIYHLSEDNVLKLIGSYAYSRRKSLSNEIKIGEGLVGQAVLEKQSIVLSNIPEDYIKVKSGIGESAPFNIIVTPCLYNNEVKCVLEIGLFQEISDIQQEFIELIGEGIATAIYSTEARNKTQVLLAKSIEQSEELQVQQEELRNSNRELKEQAEMLKESEQRLQEQQEELRQSNEVLEEQTRALKESELNLSAQQEELRVINEELEDHTKNLELQKKDILIKNEHLLNAQREIEEKAMALEAASKYKSEFLANVSHELRTPLNSILVLSQLLASKTDKSPLTDKQLEFAKTIHSSGTDLLKLINDVLDLSKVEAGKMDVNYEEIRLSELLNYVERTFRQIALNRNLDFEINLASDLPERICTDVLKVQQIINNLVSNAFKFTKKGRVTVEVSRPNKGTYPTLENNKLKLISIAISDSGIGIPVEKQSLIFEAFRQSDGTTSREYGGTGLGLSISKELAHLLGGTIELKSEVGKGSTFTLVFPEQLPTPEAIIQDQDVVNVINISESKVINEGDDTLNLSEKLLLIIDDDQSFSKIISDLAEEKGFSCLMAIDGETGIQLAVKHKPKAILLDLGLPGISGWEVIKELKLLKETKNIPIHIITGLDFKAKKSQGVIGYLKKPVTVEMVNDMFQQLTDTEPRTMKKVLIISNNAFQRKAITEVIGDKGISISTVETGQTAYDLLERKQFDCIILDLNQEDLSSYELLGRLKEQKNEVHMIVLSDKELIINEIDPIETYRDNIIIKGSRSMERLVAEVSLFLHGVDAKGSDKHMETKKLQVREAPLNNKKVLIIDDDMRNVFALTSALEEKGMKVIIGKNGREGIDKLHLNPDIDLILMDIMMPEMDGYEAMRNIRMEEKFFKTPIIALTAKAMKEDKTKCIEAGANDYLTKPIELDKLISLLRVWLY